jgi:hypothetical protein
MAWFTVRCVFHHADQDAYEERITLWDASGFEQALEFAEREAERYAAALGDDARYVGLSQAYEMSEVPQHGAELYSLLRHSALSAKVYIDTFFTTGHEITQ